MKILVAILDISPSHYLRFETFFNRDKILVKFCLIQEYSWIRHNFYAIVVHILEVNILQRSIFLPKNAEFNSGKLINVCVTMPYF